MKTNKLKSLLNIAVKLSAQNKPFDALEIALEAERSNPRAMWETSIGFGILMAPPTEFSSVLKDNKLMSLFVDNNLYIGETFEKMGGVWVFKNWETVSEKLTNIAEKFKNSEVQSHAQPKLVIDDKPSPQMLNQFILNNEGLKQDSKQDKAHSFEEEREVMWHLDTPRAISSKAGS